MLPLQILFWQNWDAPINKCIKSQLTTLQITLYHFGFWIGNCLLYLGFLGLSVAIIFQIGITFNLITTN
jgi:hypothetical protein